MNAIHLGILGGGQLARMLAQAAQPLGISPAILTTQSQDPAAQVAGNTQVGSLSDDSDLRKFFRQPLSALTFESEFVDIGQLRKLIPAQLPVFPALDAIELLQDRKSQKECLDRFKIPTSPWTSVSSTNELNEAGQKFDHQFVLKQRRFGYDGYGTFHIKGDVDPKILATSEHGFIAEERIHFKRELAISFVRGKKGEFVALPLVETVQKDSRCFSVVGPIQHRGLKKLSQQVKKMMTSLHYVGILAVELFDTPQGLLVNELAPRVHNSAHYSQNALTCSQFEYHIRAGLGLPLPAVQLVKNGFAMVNLLGEGKLTQLSHKPHGHLHWYGKAENRPGRKLGHINTLDSSPGLALKKALRWRKDFSL